MKYRILPLIIAAIIFASCENLNDEMFPDNELPLVIEGWIEEGQPPVIMVTRAVNLTDTLLSFDDCVEKWCRVSIFDNGQQHILSGRVDKNYLPSFIFTSNKIKGAVGHVYDLLVETEDTIARATATMLPAPQITSLRPKKLENSDSLYSITAFIEGLNSNCYYKFFEQQHSKETHFYPSFMGTFTSDEYNSHSGFNITKGTRISTDYDTPNFSHYFNANDVVTVKIFSLEQPIYDFWKTYDQQITLTNNLFFTFSENCPGNISGALGYWAAYGASRASIRLPR